jgi:hypothetical protein
MGVNMDMKSLMEIRKELGYKKVTDFIEDTGESTVATVRLWINTYPRRLDLIVKGLMYEKSKSNEMLQLSLDIQSGKKVVVNVSSVNEVLDELEEARNMVKALTLRIEGYKHG